MKNILLLLMLGLPGFFPRNKMDPHAWKLGVELYTFHNLSLPGQLASVDSVGLQYAEGYSFGSAGPDFGDSTLGQLSPASITKVNALIKSHGIKMESIYLGGGNTLDAWEKEFRLAKQMHVKFVTAEPPINMLDGIDRLAGIYGIRLAIHNHWKGVSQYWSPDTVLAALKNHPNLGVCADLGHWPKSGINPVEALKKLQGHLIAIHFKDVAAANNPTLLDVPVGTGINDFPAIFRELERQKFDGYIYIERDAQDKPSNLHSVIETIRFYNKQLGLSSEIK